MALTQTGENQRKIGVNLSKIIGLKDNAEKMKALNMERQKGGFNAVYFNGRNAGTESGGTNPTCTPCGGGGGGSGGGGSGGGGGVQPSGNCEKKNISELKQVLEDYANQSFCDKEFPEVQFSTFIGYDKPPSDSTAKEIELRILCPVDDCGHEQSYTYKIGTYRIPCDSARYTEVKFEHGEAIDENFFEMKLKKFSSKAEFVNFYNKCLNEAVALIDDTSCYEVVYATENDVSLHNNLGGTDTNLMPSAFYRMNSNVGLKPIKRCYCDLVNYWTSSVMFCFMTAGGTYYPTNQRKVLRNWCF